MAGLSAKQKILADKLFAAGAVKFGAFKLKLHETNPNAPLSPIFFNLRTPDNPKPGPLTDELVDLIADEMVALIRYQDRFDHVAGVPRAGDPFAAAVAKKMDHCLQIKLAKTETVAKRTVAELIDGQYKADDAVLVVDDLVTAADSMLEAIKVLRRYGLVVTQAAALIDRQQGGAERLFANGVWLGAAFTVTDLLDHYVATGAITEQQATTVREYLAK